MLPCERKRKQWQKKGIRLLPAPTTVTAFGLQEKDGGLKPLSEHISSCSDGMPESHTGVQGLPFRTETGLHE